MTVYPTWRAGKKVSAELLTEQQTHIVIASSNLVRSNTATPTSDTALSFALAVDARYIVEAFIAFDAVSTTPDITVSWSVPSGTTGGRFCFGAATPGSTFTDETNGRVTVRSQSIGSNTNYTQHDNPQSITEILSLITSSTAGNVVFQWSQSTATASNTTRLADSYLRIERVG